MAVTARQTQLVQESFARVAPFTEQAAELFYGRLFELDPALSALFTGDIRQQGRKLIQTLAVVVLGLDYFERLVPALRNLGRRHINYGVLPEHYAIAKDALLWMLDQMLGEAFTAETRTAWATVYNHLAETMQSALPGLSVNNVDSID
jgi:hemoglobin-like flavoprotein